jgi:hypothetical protein
MCNPNSKELSILFISATTARNHFIKILKSSSRFLSQEQANAAGGTRGALPRSRTPRCTFCKKTSASLEITPSMLLEIVSQVPNTKEQC